MRWWLGTTLLAASVGCDTGEPIEVDTGALTFEVCAEVQETANRVPVNLLLTIDRSGSMADGQPPKWDAMTSALQSFVDTPDAQQLRVGLRVWPADDGCNTDECDAEVCSQPQVPVGSLESEDQRTALLDEVAAGTPEGDTPMSAALHGARTWAQRVQGEVPEEQVAIALLTDGIPNGCDESIDNISSIASDALDDGTPTYVLGIEGSRVEDVDQIATQGGTEQAFFVGTDNAESELLDALLAIQGDVLSCSYDFPMGKELNPARIRVELEIEGEPTRLRRVDGPDACDDGGFFLSEDGDRITLCEPTCDEVRDVLSGEIDIFIGCTCETDDDCPENETCEDNVCDPVEPGEGDDDPAGEPRVQGGAARCQTGTGLAPVWLGLGLIGLLRRREGDA